MNEDNLMKQVANGNIMAFTSLMERYQDKALRFCYRHLGDYQLAEDISQDGFIRLYQVAKQYKPEGKFYLFFYKILNNLCLDAGKKVRYRPVVPNNPGLEDSVTGNQATCSPTQALETNEINGLVRNAIDQLPDNYRQVIIWNELEGLKYSEIAMLMGYSLDNIKVLIHRARKQLAEILKPQLSQSQQ